MLRKMPIVEYSDFSDRVKVIKSKRRKRTISLAIKNGTVEIRVPYFTSRRTLKQVYRKHSKWISNKLALASKSPPLNKRDHLLYRGIRHQIIFSDQEHANINNNSHTITLPSSANQATLAFRELLKTGLEKDLSLIITKHAQSMNAKHGLIRVKDVRSYWGSCSAKNNISFNLRLYQAPREVLEYVVVHELAHTRIRGHSTKFWKYVSRFIPDWRKRKRWLRDHHQELEF